MFNYLFLFVFSHITPFIFTFKTFNKKFQLDILHSEFQEK